MIVQKGNGKYVKVGVCVCTYVHKHAYMSFWTWTYMTFEEVQVVLGREFYTYRTLVVGRNSSKDQEKTQQLD